MWSNAINSDVIAVSKINYHHLTQQWYGSYKALQDNACVNTDMS